MRNIISNAIHNYENNNYIDALNLFKKASKVYGENAFLYYINKCLENINKSNKTYSYEDKDYSKLEIKIDLASKIMLANSNKENINEKEKVVLIKKWKKLTNKKSEELNVNPINPMPRDWPNDLFLSPLPEGPNDFLWNEKHRKHINSSSQLGIVGLSIIIPTFNRSWILDITLACLVNQECTYPFEVIVADDGSEEDLTPIIRKYESNLDIKYVRQKDYGYQLCAVRNLGLRTSKYDFVSILDCDMAPNRYWVQSYIELLLKNDDVALIGPRKYVDTHNITTEQILQNPLLIESLPEVKTNNNAAGQIEGEISIDWRLEHFKKTDNLRLCDSPFRYFSGGNVAFAKKWLHIAGWFDEEFTHWGGEDNEFGYRLFKHGCFFRAVDGGMAYHQEPPGKENETDRDEGKKITLQIVREKVPYFYRKLLSIENAHIHRVPLVSIYIPAYNCESTIQRAVESALNQSITDLEVCICDDGSTDNTWQLLNTLYANHPRVRIMSKENGGISSASNCAVKMARGFYIGQLDSDDYLEPDAVEVCLKEFLKNRNLACVYTTNRNVNPDGSLIQNGYNWPEFSREKLTTAMIVHHFRMFSARAWYLTEGFNEKIENAVDLDIYLKLSEVGEFKHINKICYNRVLHGENTSIKKLDIQKKNHFLVINQALKRQKIDNYKYEAIDNDNSNRSYRFVLNKNIIPKSYSTLSSHCETNHKMVFNIVCASKPIGIERKIDNLIEYNKNIVTIIFCIHKKFITSELQKSVTRLSEKYNIKILINDNIENDNVFKLNQAEAYLSNYLTITDNQFEYDYMIFDNYDSIFVRHEVDKHICQFDYGINYGNIDGYWKEKILSHKTLHSMVEKHIKNKKLSELTIKGTFQGAFIKKKYLQEIFNLILELKNNALKEKQAITYLSHEVWFPLATMILKNKYNSLKHTHTLTYLPWDRKLEWTDQQIDDAKKGIGIPNKKYCINKIDFNSLGEQL